MNISAVPHASPAPHLDVPRRSQTVYLDEWVGPELCDREGLLKPGKILEWMDVVGVLVSTRHAGRPVVTASVDGLNFERPVAAGDRVSIRAQVAFTSARSIGVSVLVQRIASGEREEPRRSFRSARRTSRTQLLASGASQTLRACSSPRSARQKATGHRRCGR